MVIAKEKQKVETFYLVNLIAKLSGKQFYISDHQSIGPKEIPQVGNHKKYHIHFQIN